MLPTMKIGFRPCVVNALMRLPYYSMYESADWAAGEQSLTQ
jgi:hypothetical protein